MYSGEVIRLPSKIVGRGCFVWWEHCHSLSIVDISLIRFMCGLDSITYNSRSSYDIAKKRSFKLLRSKMWIYSMGSRDSLLTSSILFPMKFCLYPFCDLRLKPREKERYIEIDMSSSFFIVDVSFIICPQTHFRKFASSFLRCQWIWKIVK